MAKDKKNTGVSSQDLTGKSADELNTMLLDLRKTQLNLRFQKAGGGLENTSEVRKVRRTIARIKTMLNQQAAGQASAAPKTQTKKAKAA